LEQLKAWLDNLWANVIDEINIDVFNHRITFSTKAIDNGTITNYQLTFEEVSSFYFVEGTGEDRFNLLEPEEDSYLELTTIDYHPNGIGSITVKSKTEEWVKRYISNSNFTIEIWNSMLFVEAERLVINGKTFDVGYPK
jgi:hypothetical protein